MSKGLSRRGLSGLLGVAGLSAGGAASTAAATTPSKPLDLQSPEGQLHAFLKVYTSLAKARVWYWYTGVIDAALVNGPVIPLFAVDTLIRRDMTPRDDGRFEMEMFEGSYFHPVGDARPLDRMINPLNGREVHAFHYREGPYQVGYRGLTQYDPKTGEPLKGFPALSIRFMHAHDQLWFSRDNYIDTPNPFDMADWPMESSGPRQTVGSFATHYARYSEVADPAVKTARSAFHYEAFMDWLPWMLMAQTPGRMVWRADGLKLTSLADLPPDARAGFEATHPQLFLDRPWTEFANMRIDYQRERKPAPR